MVMDLQTCSFLGAFVVPAPTLLSGRSISSWLKYAAVSILDANWPIFINLVTNSLPSETPLVRHSVGWLTMSAADMSAALFGELRHNKDHICGYSEKHAEGIL